MDVQVIIPEESYSGIEFIQNDQRGVASVNVSLVSFQFKAVFPWHLSIMLELEDVDSERLPSPLENEVIDGFEDEIIDAVGQDTPKPNGIFLARIAWNSTVELIWRIHDPEPINTFLKKILSDKSYSRKFDFRIDPDKEWGLASWHLSHFNPPND